ncbi:MAG TPA: carboxypeptidase regulatory-like domain-containing protein, partial [Jatrophihabitantaceae bacterium]
MRAETDQNLLQVDPGATTDVVVDVVNNCDVIDGISANVIGLSSEYVRSTPELLPLFPATAGQLTVSLTIPPAHPAGRHALTVELVSHGAHLPSQYLDVDIEVAPRPSVAVTPQPRLVQARRSGRFVIEVTNDGNVPLNVSLEAADSDRSMSARFTPAQARVEPGTVLPVLLHVRGPRMITGAPLERPLKVLAKAERADLGEDAEPGDAALDEPRITTVRLKQRPLLSRGMMTALVLLTILALWASVFLLGLTKVFSNDPMTKAAPASFFTSAKTSTVQGAAGGTVAAPAGALPKTGQVIPGVGGEITGTVTATSDLSTVGRILVQAFRQSRNGLLPVSSAATQADGTYTLAGLFPTDYLIKFSGKNAPGTKFITQWWPRSPSQTGAKSVRVNSQGQTTGINVALNGAPASITGTVDPGDTLTPATTVVKVYSLTPTGTTKQIAKAKTAGPKHTYTISGLQAPERYELTFTTPGYQTTSLVDAVQAGDKRIEPAQDLNAATGSISGVVRANGTKVGGATVTTTVNGQAVSAITPTTGSVGTFTLTNLPTPATYVITVSDPNHGSTTDIVDLAAGQSTRTVNEDLTGGGGTISGKVTGVGADKHGLGGATVTVGGSAASTAPGGTTGATGTTGTSATSGEPSTTTVTTPGSEGNFAINGLPDGQYTLTFTATGYAPTSILVKVNSAKPAKPYRIHLVKVDGSIAGVITQVSGANGIARPLIGATVTATDGQHTWSAISTGAGPEVGNGGYII